MKIYVVTMYRWGDREAHSYVEGAYLDPIVAETMGEHEALYRGGKYEFEVLEFDPYNADHMKTYIPMKSERCTVGGLHAKGHEAEAQNGSGV